MKPTKLFPALVLLALAGCGSVKSTATATDAAVAHTEPYCPTPAEAIALGITYNRAGTVVSHADDTSNPAACAGPGPFGDGLQPGQSWRFSTIYADGSINVPVTQNAVACPGDQGGCLMSVSFTPTATSCTYVWSFRYCGNTEVGLCCEEITAQIEAPLVRLSDAGATSTP